MSLQTVRPFLLTVLSRDARATTVTNQTRHSQIELSFQGEGNTTIKEGEK